VQAESVVHAAVAAALAEAFRNCRRERNIRTLPGKGRNS